MTCGREVQAKYVLLWTCPPPLLDITSSDVYGSLSLDFSNYCCSKYMYNNILVYIITSFKPKKVFKNFKRLEKQASKEKLQREKHKKLHFHYHSL